MNCADTDAQTLTHAAELSPPRLDPTQRVSVCVCAVSLNVHIDGYATIHRSHLHRRIHRNDVTHATAHTVRLLFIDPFLLFFHLIMREKGQCLVRGRRGRVLRQDPWFLYSSPSSPTPANEHVQQAKGPFIANLIHFSRQL